jgi:3-hydroxyacyl-[acyl-carrier-protein] dehydratase
MGKVDIGLDQILKILPHRPPFLFVDSVLELEANVRILAERTLLSDEPHFAGHFPFEPIMPGVLITEALAQTAGLLHALSSMEKGEDPKGRLFYLARADMKWTSPCRPGDTLLLEASLQRTMGGLLSFQVRAFSKRADIAKGSLTLAAAPSK